jgi:TonB-linked SusC/RagA family outer membrane protein
VQDENGQPISYGTVMLEGTQMGTTTVDDGSYEIINIPAGTYTLKASYVGYFDFRQSVTVAETNQTVNIVLKATFQSLNEVVVVGYNTEKRSRITGAVDDVNAEEIAALPLGNVAQALQGKASGVSVVQNSGQPGEEVAVRVRGVGTINNNDPLYVIDGIPTKDGINFLAPNDIESITVLKDAASASIYGARAANGVVLITTKSGKQGKPLINYSGYMGVQTVGHLTPMCNSAQYVELYNESVANDNVDIPNPVLQRDPIPDSLVNYDTDWLDAIFEPAFMQNHELSVTGGGENVHYYISANYFDQDGIIPNSWFRKYSSRIKVDVNLSKKVTISNNLDVSTSNRNILGSSGDGYGGNGGSVVRYAYFRTPPIPIYNPDGSYSDLPQYPGFFGDGYNPVALADYTDNKLNTSRVFGNFNLEYKIVKDLKFKTEAGVDAILNDSKRYNKNYGTNGRINSPSSLTVASETNVNFTWNNTLTYNRTFNGVHSITGIVGTEAITNTDHIHGGSDHNFPIQISNLLYLGNGLNITSQNVFEGEQQWSLFSLFANANYAYNDKYLASFTVREDGSSRFSPDNRYATFFAGSAGWNMHNEEFIKNIEAITKLRLRASYGILGNQDIGNYPWASIISGGYNYPFGSPQTSNLVIPSQQEEMKM